MFAVTTDSGQLHSSLDVCNTESPAGPVPAVYANHASPALGMPRAEKVLIAGMPALHKNSKCLPSSGDEAGTGGGVMSATSKGAVIFTTASSKVMIEGSPAVRLNDSTSHNNHNAAGQVSMPGQTKIMIQS